jgi:hypothetical protein
MSEKDFEVLRGADAIAQATGLTPRRAYWLLEKGILPASKEGRLWVTTRDRFVVTIMEMLRPPKRETPVLRGTGASHWFNRG